MALVAFAFTPQTTRHGNMGLKLFGGICLGLLFHFAGRLFGFNQPVVRRAAVFGGCIADSFVCTVGGVSDTPSGKKIRQNKLQAV